MDIKHRLIALVCTLFLFGTATLQAQKIKVDVQKPDSAVLGQWFKASYVLSPVKDKEQKVTYDLIENKFDGFKLDDVQQGDTLYVNYMFRSKDIGKKKMPKLNVYSNGKSSKSKMPKIEVVPTLDEWQMEGGKIKAFIKAELSKPIVKRSDTVQVRYKLYFSFTDLYDIRLLEVHVPSTRDFYVTELDAAENESVTRFLGDITRGRTYRESDVGGFVLRARRSGSLQLGKGYLLIDYVVDTSNLMNKLFVGKRKIENERRQAVIPFGEVTIQVED